MVVAAAGVGAAYPEQLVVGAAAGGAWIGYFRSGRDRSELVIVRLLLAANLFVFAFATHEPLTVELIVAAFAVAFTLGTLHTHFRRRP